MSIRVIHDGAIKSAIPYVRHNDKVKIPVSGWTKTGGELKQIWPPSDMVLIYSQATLEAFRDRVNNGETSLNARVIAGFELTGEWTPIAISVRYTGTFDGGGHTIKELTMSSSIAYYGLFGTLGSGGVVKNLTLEDVSISGISYAGAIVGFNEGGTIENCTISSGTITASERVGGIAGSSSAGTITNCTNAADITAELECAGGIVGWSMGDAITSCVNAGNVTAMSGYAGGIAGYANGATTIADCSNSGTVTSDGYAGDIVGYAG